MAQGVKAPATKPFLQKLYTMLEDESGPARSKCCLGGATACCPGRLGCEASGLGCSTHSRGAPTPLWHSGSTMGLLPACAKAAHSTAFDHPGRASPSCRCGRSAP